jgi:hypothetical protein
LPRGLLANPGRICSSVLASSDAFELDGHGFETDDPLVFRIESGGTMPAPIATGTTYRAIRVSDTLFQVAAAAAGPAIDLTTDGALVVVATPLPFDEVLEFYSRFVDGCIPAHAVPLTAPYPITVTALVAELSAHRLLLIAGQSSESMTAIELGAKAQLERFANGMVPGRDARFTASTNLAVAASTAAADPRGWGAGGLIP